MSQDDPRLFIFGAGQNAEVAAYYFGEAGRFSEIIFSVDDDYFTDPTVDGHAVLPFSDATRKARPGVDVWFTGMSGKRRSVPRQQKADEIASLGFGFASYVHPTAIVWRGFTLQPNCLVLENNVLQYKCSLGPNSIIWSNSHIGHHTRIGANTFITSEVVISGDCTIGNNCFFGVNATVFDGIISEDQAVIGAGAVVRENVSRREVVRD